VTSQKLADRRTSMLNSLAAVPVQTIDAVFAHIVTTLETNPNDIPLALLYKFEQGAGPVALQLQGHIGLAAGHPLLVDTAYMESEQGLVPDMRRAGSDIVVFDCDERFEGAVWSGWSAPSKKIAVLPITSGSSLFGYLLVGTNPYRPHNDLCKQFIHDLSRMVSSIVSAVVESESVKRRQEQLEADLAFSDLKLRHLIEHASVGMCHVSLDGLMLWANDQYYRLAGMSAEEHIPQYSCFDAYLDEDRPKAVKTFENLLAGRDHAAVELRLKRVYMSPKGEPEPAQIQVLAFPYRNPNTGQVKSIMACTTDISELKWASSYEARQAAEAREAKRQQEAFIDVVSHEMRM
jgi:PAS domain S-box-containing protein